MQWKKLSQNRKYESWHICTPEMFLSHPLCWHEIGSFPCRARHILVTPLYNPLIFLTNLGTGGYTIPRSIESFHIRSQTAGDKWGKVCVFGLERPEVQHTTGHVQHLREPVGVCHAPNKARAKQGFKAPRTASTHYYVPSREPSRIGRT